MTNCSKSAQTIYLPFIFGLQPNYSEKPPYNSYRPKTMILLLIYHTICIHDIQNWYLQKMKKIFNLKICLFRYTISLKLQFCCYFMFRGNFQRFVLLLIRRLLELSKRLDGLELSLQWLIGSARAKRDSFLAFGTPTRQLETFQAPLLQVEGLKSY